MKRSKGIAVMNKLLLGTVLGLVCGAAAFGGIASADPLGGKEPWNFTPVNRAGLAVAIKGIEDPNSVAGGGGSGTTIVCGGTSGGQGDGSTGSGSSATANNNCVIVNNSTGVIIDTDQDSVGNQDSNANASSSSNSGGSIDDVSSILSGNKQGL
jgi:hypothetical protein